MNLNRLVYHFLVWVGSFMLECEDALYVYIYELGMKFLTQVQN
jgi:hypothetical protein